MSTDENDDGERIESFIRPELKSIDEKRIENFATPPLKTVQDSQEKSRRFLSIFFPLAYSITGLSVLGSTLLGETSIDDAAKIVAIFISPLLAINATILGFYFAKKN